MKIRLKKATNYKDTVGYIGKALKEIESNPNHEYSEEEVARIKSLTKPIQIPESIFRIHNDMLKGMEAFVKMVKTIGDEALNNLKYASARGWYISPNIVNSYPMGELTEHLNPKKFNVFEKRIINEADSLVPNIIHECSTQFPHRKQIFKELKQLYSSKCYYSLIALAYAQADGICNEIWGVGFFDREKFDNKQNNKIRKLKVLKAVEGTDASISAIIASQLEIQQNEITQSSFDPILNEPSRKIKSFNRHFIQHGHSIEYGSKVNAIRSIYLLDFIIYLKQNPE